MALEESLTRGLGNSPLDSVLAPFLFIIFINDMPEVVDSLIRMFADHTKLSRTVNREPDSLVLQKDLIPLQEWSNKWQLKCKVVKCKILHIGEKNPNQKYYMTQSGKPVEHETKLETVWISI